MKETRLLLPMFEVRISRVKTSSFLFGVLWHLPLILVVVGILVLPVNFFFNTRIFSKNKNSSSYEYFCRYFSCLCRIVFSSISHPQYNCGFSIVATLNSLYLQFIQSSTVYSQGISPRQSTSHFSWLTPRSSPGVSGLTANWTTRSRLFASIIFTFASTVNFGKS